MNLKNTLFTFLILFTAMNTTSGQNPTTEPTVKKSKILIHITQGLENPTKAALGFLVARTALEEGHSVDIFLAGDAVKLLQDNVLNTLTGLGTGNLREHYDAIVKNNGKFYLSGNSSKARGMTDEDIKGKPATFALPTVLLKLSLESDRMFTY
jgi:predicted peroxiredoxin